MSETAAHAGPARFYADVTVVQNADPDRSGFEIRLDGRPARTPARHVLALPSRALAELVAGEWQAQAARVNPVTMPVTRLANVALDRTPQARADVAAHTARYIETDLVCHPAVDEPDLLALQEAAFAPLRAWSAGLLGATLVRAESIFAASQPAQAHTEALSVLEAMDDFRLTGVAHATGLLGSVILALALEAGQCDGPAAFAAYHIDDDWQAERWGQVEEARAARADHKAQVLAVAAYLAALRDGAV